MEKIIISKYRDKRFCACISSRKLQYLEFEDETNDLIGRVYVGKVKNVVKNINACFVEYEKGKLAFLPFNSIRPETILSQNNNSRLIPVAGDDVLIQIIKAPLKTKEATASGSIRINRRKADPNKSDIFKKARNSTCFSCIFYPENFYIRFIQTYTKLGFDEIVTDIEDIYSDIKASLGFCDKTVLISENYTVNYSESFTANNNESVVDNNESIVDNNESIVDNNIERPNTFTNTSDVSLIKPRKEKAICCNNEGHILSLHTTSDISLFSLYGLNAAFEEIFSKNVWLKCGGYIVIEPTEALVSIDVNSGKAINKKGLEENRLLINLQAVEEAARQIRLRNLSGMILIDLINMDDEASKLHVIDSINKSLALDNIKVDFIDITPLGLAEIVRKKISRPIHEIFRTYFNSSN